MSCGPSWTVTRGPVTDFETFEREAQRRFAAAQAEFVAEELARLDIDGPTVEIDGVGIGGCCGARKRT